MILSVLAVTFEQAMVILVLSLSDTSSVELCESSYTQKAYYKYFECKVLCTRIADYDANKERKPIKPNPASIHPDHLIPSFILSSSSSIANQYKSDDDVYPHYNEPNIQPVYLCAPDRPPSHYL